MQGVPDIIIDCCSGWTEEKRKILAPAMVGKDISLNNLQQVSQFRTEMQNKRTVYLGRYISWNDLQQVS